ncbi:pentapeptide MXKDX repeat protein [Brucella sp. 63/311]|nr:pentapeptide MXKDX repeat protein [Brucella sp. 63/311]
MDRHLDRALAHVARPRGLVNRLSLDLHLADQTGGPLRNAAQHTIHIHARFHICRLAWNGNILVQHIGVVAALTAQVINQLVPRNGIDPWQKCHFTIIGHAARMDRQQRFLHQIFGFRNSAAEKPPNEIGFQETRKLFKQRPVSRTISIQRQQHQGLQPLFIRTGQSRFSCRLIRDRDEKGYIRIPSDHIGVNDVTFFPIQRNPSCHAPMAPKFNRSFVMTIKHNIIAFSALALIAGFSLTPAAFAEDAMKTDHMKSDAMKSDNMSKDAMGKEDAMKGDAMHKDSKKMKKHDAMKGDAMKGDAMKGDAMKSGQ